MTTPHRRNAIAKAVKAVETIETSVIWVLKDDKDFPEVTDTHTGLRFVHNALFGTSAMREPKVADALWGIIGGFYAIDHARKPEVVTFNTSRPYIAAELANRVHETKTPTTSDDDPFDCFATNASEQN